jgi:hypothetical protein
MRAEILGVRLRGRAEAQRSPITSLEVPLKPGLTALAGLNGAGKSRVLEGVTSALKGTDWPDGDWEVLYRIVEGDSRNEELEEATLRAITSRRPGESGELSDWRAALAAYMASEVWYFPPEDDDAAPDLLDDETARCLAEQACFALVPSRHGFAITAALDRQTESPALRVLVSGLDLHWDREVEDLRARMASEDESEHFPGEYRPFGDSYWLFAGIEQSPHVGTLLPVSLFTLRTFEDIYPDWPINVLSVDDPADVSELTRGVLAAFLTDREGALSLLAAEDALEASGVGSLEAIAATARDVTANNSDSSAESRVDGVQGAAALLSGLAMAWYSRLTGDGLPIVCALKPVHTWLSAGSGFRWQAMDVASGRYVDLDDLSASQRRWTRFAISVALRTLDRITERDHAAGRFEWLLIDEPEHGVHRTAEAALASGLRSQTEVLGAGVIVATHSPAFIASAHQVWHVRRDSSGAVELRSLPQEAMQLADDLGLTPTDLLGWYRRILFVEGSHDEAVIRALLADTVAQTRTLIVPIRGIRSAGNVTDATLLQFTDAKIVMLTDSLGRHAAADWLRCQELAAAGSKKEAQQHLIQSFGDGRYESRFLREVGERLLQRGELGRVSVVALSVPDVVELLPASAVLGVEVSWAEARSAYAADPRARGVSFKDWVVRRYRAPPISARRIRAIANTLDEIPDDLGQLIEALHWPDSDFGVPESPETGEGAMDDGLGE